MTSAVPVEKEFDNEKIARVLLIYLFILIFFKFYLFFIFVQTTSNLALHIVGHCILCLPNFNLIRCPVLDKIEPQTERQKDRETPNYR